MLANKHNVLNINDSESSISYHKSEIANNRSYKVSLNELLDIFNKCHEDIYECDSSGCFRIVIRDQEISLQQYRKLQKTWQLSEKVIDFFRFSDNILMEDLLMSADIMYGADMSERRLMPYTSDKLAEFGSEWPFMYMTWVDDQIQESEKDFDGYENTLKIKNSIDPNAMSDKNLHVTTYCDSISKEINGKSYIAYIPAYEQMLLIERLVPFLNYIRGTENPSLTRHGYWWTSTSVKAKKPGNYYLTCSYTEIKHKIIKKDFLGMSGENTGYIFPVFKEIIKKS